MKILFLAVLLSPGFGRAELSSPLPWLGETVPSELLQYREYDIRLISRVQMAAPVWGLRCEAGLGGLPLLGTTSVNLEWNWQGDQGRLLQAGFKISPEIFNPVINAWYFDLGWQDPKTLGDRRFGAVKGLNLGDWQFSVNSGALLRDDPLRGYKTLVSWENRAGIRSPYLFWFTQIGLDGFWLSETGAKGVTPQIFINLIGDISIQAGATLGDSPPLWSFVLSYEIFPSP